MPRKTLTALAFGLSTLVCGQGQAAEKAADSVHVVVDTVHYTSGSDSVRALLFHRSNDSSAPGLVVIHEWWGLSEWVKQSAERLARSGYAALAIDLYRGHVAQTADEAHELMRGVPEDRAARDLKAAVAILRRQKGVDPERLGSIGWCMGGGYSMETALFVPDLKACVVCYGRLPADDSTLAPLSAQVLGIFGAEDRGIPAASVTAFQEQATRLGKKVDMKVYEGVGHAFMNSGNEKYSEAAAERAWGEILGFLDRTLKPHK